MTQPPLAGAQKPDRFCNVSDAFVTPTTAFDGSVSEPFPKEVAQDGFYERFMDAGGYPMYPGSSWNTARGVMTPFSGFLFQLKVYSYARFGDELIRAANEK